MAILFVLPFTFFVFNSIEPQIDPLSPRFYIFTHSKSSDLSAAYLICLYDNDLYMLRSERV